MSPTREHIPDSRNRLLAALLTGEFKHIASSLERVSLSLEHILYQARDKIDHVYFPENAVISLLSTMGNGDTTEVGLIGKEGMVGIEVFLEGNTIHDQALVQVAGTAMRMPAAALGEELRGGSPLQILLLRYTRTLLAMVSQSGACNQHHSVEQRVSRWLMLMSDYADTDELQLTQELISKMLGSRRAGVTKVAALLQEAGAIEYRRGKIRIIDRRRLEACACECYRVIRGNFDRLYSSQDMLIERE